MTPGSPDQLGDVKEVADVCQCSPSTVWRRVADGTIPKPIKIGGMTRWSMSEIAAAIEAVKAQREAA
ncbi:helix-turn-helix transcriptional regulator [Roseovarius aestuarii]|uniref:Helix-turn-helix domain protein n=1 Tax=Roseovarius aestuarii TaxID=475083 RepID=A0A1X7BW73_9RHOB|nr:helix-turn-helix domain-containing protein [Roseovarius aestuarii]SMC13740.1 Helix-turn-helix domain protein [Roseovarius aestuarii]